MEQEGKTNFSFASIAISFFILIVLPLTITGVIISKGVVKVGEEATQANLRILDDSQKQSIGGRAQTVADAVAQFLSDREKDIRIASILPRDENSYTTFIRSNTRGIIKSSNVGMIKIPMPLYREISFLNKSGMEVLKVTNEGVVAKGKLKDMSNPDNGEYGSEDYFLKAKSLAPGEYYMGPVVGRHVSKAEFAEGKRFDAIIRLATPVFDSNGFAGVVGLALEYVHIMEFTDHIIPTESGMFFAEINADDMNYAFMVDREGFMISHPLDYFLRGLDENMNPVEVMNEQNYQELSKTGTGSMNVLSMGFIDENLPKIQSLASEGKSGSLTYTLKDKRIFVAYAHIPYYGNGFSKPQGFGWVGMIVDIDKYHHLSQEKVKEIQLKVERWQKSSIVVVFVSLILLFIIALILARGLYRSIQSARRPGEATRLENDED
ncbi:MAG TPA: hypothetical protein ENN05_09110 [Deltaproteobacteria bacterium]|nr:hypothetical protein [Deltaproteobacteria bacterium]